MKHAKQKIRFWNFRTNVHKMGVQVDDGTMWSITVYELPITFDGVINKRLVITHRILNRVLKSKLVCRLALRTALLLCHYPNSIVIIFFCIKISLHSRYFVWISSMLRVWYFIQTFIAYTVVKFLPHIENGTPWKK